MENIQKYIENTILKQNATSEEIIKLAQDAKKYEFHGICINPCFIKLAKENLKDSNVKIVTVVGFPLGSNVSEIKAFETTKCIEDGADEIDMVINVSELKNKNFDFVRNDIKKVKEACADVPLKVIIETDLLTREEIEVACNLAVEAGADFVKTSTGFVKDGVGAKVEDVALMYKIVSPHGLQVKASGGIKTKEYALKLLEVGAERLGTSSGVQIINE